MAAWPAQGKRCERIAGCSVTASSLATSCYGGERQCEEYKLELQVHRDTADVKGSYRQGWCSHGITGSGGRMGSTVPITGKAVRK